MCPHGYHHSGSMATPALGTRDVRFIYIYLKQTVKFKIEVILKFSNFQDFDIYLKSNRKQCESNKYACTTMNLINFDKISPSNQQIMQLRLIHCVSLYLKNCFTN